MTDAERTARIGHNEGVFREVNERIEHLNRSFAAISDGMMHIVCECGERSCVDQLNVTPEEYERIRRDSAQFLIKPGHEKPSTEDVIEEHDGYYVVRKQGEIAERIAEETDPRTA
jgi:hypothetical protein